MKLCNTCGGLGEAHGDICPDCDGEGVNNAGTFTVGRVRRSKTVDMEIEERKIKIDKKNARRTIQGDV